MWKSRDMDLHDQNRRVTMEDLNVPNETARSVFRGMISVMALAALTTTHDATAAMRDRERDKEGHLPFSRPTAEEIESFFNNNWVYE